MERVRKWERGRKGRINKGGREGAKEGGRREEGRKGGREGGRGI